MTKISIVAFLASVSIVGFAQESVFRVPVRVVSVPTAVVSPDGRMIRGLSVQDFRLFDNDHSQNVRLDYVEEALSVAVVVQTNDAARAWLPQIRRVASVVEAMLLGATGEASVTTFGDEINPIQPLSSDMGLLDKSFASISARGGRSRCLDAVLAAARQLEAVSFDRRRVVLLIAQSNDVGSTAQLRDVLRELDLNNIVLYTLVMPRIGKDLIGRTISIGSPNGAFGRADTGIMGTIDLGKLIPEILREEKANIGLDEATVLAAEMGGRRIPFRKLHELEQGISVIGTELHTEYLLSYTPDRPTPGYHQIRVQVDRPNVVVRSRPGYYVSQSDSSH